MHISFRGRKIHYSDAGTGKVVVLIHGYLESMEIWEIFSNKLAENFRVLGIDLPGHGLSEPCSEVISMELFAEVIKELLDSLGIKKAFLVGHSMGGYVTLAFLDLFPGYLSGYSLFHSHPFSDTNETIERRKQNIAIVERGEKDRMIPEFIKSLYFPGNIDRLKSFIDRSVSIAARLEGKIVVADLKGMMERPDRAKLVEEGKVPFLWILGKMDNHIDSEAIQKKVKLPGNSRVVVLNNSGHMGFIEEEELSLKIVTDFVHNLK